MRVVENEKNVDVIAYCNKKSIKKIYMEVIKWQKQLN